MGNKVQTKKVTFSEIDPLYVPSKDPSLVIDLDEAKAAREAKRESAMRKNTMAASGVLLVDSMDLTAIFGTFLTTVGQRFLEEIGHYFMFPIAAAAHLIEASLAWREVYLREKGDRSGAVVRAAVQTVGALAVAAAVVGGIFFSTVMGALAPVIFALTISAKSIFKLGSGFYYWGRYASESNEKKKQEYGALAKSSFISFGAGVVAAVAVTAVMILAKPILAPLGIAAGVISSAIAVFKGVSTWLDHKKAKAANTKKENDEEKGLLSDDELKPAPGPTNSLGIMQGLEKGKNQAAVTTMEQSTQTEEEDFNITNISTHSYDVSSAYEHGSPSLFAIKGVPEQEQPKPALEITTGISLRNSSSSQE